jgi:hypothetical protein
LVSTVTTSVSSITTISVSSVGVGGGEIAVFGFMTMLTLIAFLCFQEVVSKGKHLAVRRLCRMSNTAVVPLLFALAATVVIRVASVL